jgi:hypothetical protein
MVMVIASVEVMVMVSLFVVVYDESPHNCVINPFWGCFDNPRHFLNQGPLPIPSSRVFNLASLGLSPDASFSLSKSFFSLLGSVSVGESLL